MVEFYNLLFKYSDIVHLTLSCLEQIIDKKSFNQAFCKLNITCSGTRKSKTDGLGPRYKQPRGGGVHVDIFATILCDNNKNCSAIVRQLWDNNKKFSAIVTQLCDNTKNCSAIVMQLCDNNKNCSAIVLQLCDNNKTAVPQLHNDGTKTQCHS